MEAARNAEVATQQAIRSKVVAEKRMAANAREVRLEPAADQAGCTRYNSRGVDGAAPTHDYHFI